MTLTSATLGFVLGWLTMVSVGEIEPMYSIRMDPHVRIPMRGGKSLVGESDRSDLPTALGPVFIVEQQENVVDRVRVQSGG